jgi:hypothetical protein
MHLLQAHFLEEKHKKQPIDQGLDVQQKPTELGVPFEYYGCCIV